MSRVADVPIDHFGRAARINGALRTQTPDPHELDAQGGIGGRRGSMAGGWNTYAARHSHEGSDTSPKVSSGFVRGFHGLMQF